MCEDCVNKLEIIEFEIDGAWEIAKKDIEKIQNNFDNFRDEKRKERDKIIAQGCSKGWL